MNFALQNYTNTIKYCATPADKEFTIAINGGRIYAADSCYGYSFEIGFNPEKIRFNSKLIQNTLAEFFEFSDATFHKEGYVRGYAANLSNKLVYGDKPLMAFFGSFLNDCEDTTNFTLNYIEFTDEFKGIVDSLKGLNLAITKNLSSKDSLIATADASYLNFTGIEKKELTIVSIVNSVKAYKNSRISLEFSKKLENFNISNIRIIEPNNVKIDSIVEKIEALDVYINITNPKLNQQVILSADIESRKNIVSNEWFKIQSYVDNQCNCISNSIGLDINLISEKNIDSTSSVRFINEENIIQRNNSIILKKEISKISIYDVCGILISEINTNENSIIDLNNLNNGIYFLVYDLNMKRNNKIILINKF